MSELIEQINKVSDQAVLNATSKHWHEWIRVIDSFGGASMTHKQIARKLWEDKLVKNGWWCQQVTVGYEYAKGRRILGQTKGAGFEVGVSKTLSLTSQAVWKFMFSVSGLKIWLDAALLKLQKGSHFESKSKIQGEVRSLDPGKKIRLKINNPNWGDKPTTLQLYFEDKGNKSILRFHHEKLTGAKQRSIMKNHWQEVLAQINNELGKQ